MQLSYSGAMFNLHGSSRSEKRKKKTKHAKKSFFPISYPFNQWFLTFAYVADDNL